MSCTRTLQQASYASKHAHMGMSISEFKSKVGKNAIIEVMESGYTVYRLYDFGTIKDIAQGASPKDTTYFYFDSNEKLYLIDSGVFKKTNIKK